MLTLVHSCSIIYIFFTGAWRFHSPLAEGGVKMDIIYQVAETLAVLIAIVIFSSIIGGVILAVFGLVLGRLGFAIAGSYGLFIGFATLSIVDFAVNGWYGWIIWYIALAAVAYTLATFLAGWHARR